MKQLLIFLLLSTTINLLAIEKLMLPEKVVQMRVDSFLNDVNSIGTGIDDDLKIQIIEFAQKRMNFQDPEKELKIFEPERLYFYTRNDIKTSSAAKFAYTYPKMIDELLVFETILETKQYASDPLEKSEYAYIIKEFGLQKVSSLEWRKSLDLLYPSSTELDLLELQISKVVAQHLLTRFAN